MKQLHLFFYLLIFLAFTSSCVSENDFETPEIKIEEPNIKATNTIQSIIKMYKGFPIDFSQNSADLIIEGYVTSSDEAGNFYKTLTIQDKPKNPTAAIQISIDAVKLYTYFNVGRKVYVQLNGLGMHSNKGVLEIGKLNGNSVERIPSSSYKNIIIRSTETTIIEPLPLESIRTISDNHINMLIELTDMRSIENDITYANINYTFPVNRTLESCYNRAKITLRTSGYASFKGQSIPNKKGKIIGILGKYNSSYQLFIRDTDDVNFTEDYNCNTVIKKLDEIRSIFTNTELQLKENAIVKVTITSDKNASNLENNKAFGQDETAGIALIFNQSHNLEMGEEIEIFINDAILKQTNGLLELHLDNTAIISRKKSVLPKPKEITIEQALTGKNESELVTIKNVQFKDTSKKYTGDNLISSDCTNELNVYIQSGAIFAEDDVSKNNGTITGVLSKQNIPSLYLPNKNAIEFNADYACSNSNSSTTITSFDFENIAKISASYKTSEILNASDGTTLQYIARTNLGKYAIDNKGLMIKQGSFITITFPKGVKTLRFLYKSAFTNSSDRILLVLEGDKDSEKELVRKTFAFNSTTQELNLELNKTSPYTVTIKSGTTRQIVIDNIIWEN